MARLALEPLQRRYGTVAGTLILAALWAGWHTSLFFIVETYRTEVQSWTAVGLSGPSECQHDSCPAVCD